MMTLPRAKGFVARVPEETAFGAAPAAADHCEEASGARTAEYAAGPARGGLEEGARERGIIGGQRKRGNGKAPPSVLGIQAGQGVEDDVPRAAIRRRLRSALLES